MKRILASGVFDILHPGHVFYLEEAAKLGDHLSVIITADAHATASKRRPLHSAAQRAAMIGALGVVDEVLIGADPYDLIAMTRRAAPDVIALGHDQGFDEALLASDLAAHGIEVTVVRINHYPHGNIRTRDLLRETNRTDQPS